MPKQYSSPPEMAIDTNKTYSATISTNHGELTVELFASEVTARVNTVVFRGRGGFYQAGGCPRGVKGVRQLKPKVAWNVLVALIRWRKSTCCRKRATPYYQAL